MQGYLIDTTKPRVTTVEHDGTLDSCHKILGVNSIDCARISAKDGIYIDDEGLTDAANLFFYVYGFPDLIAGKGLLLGVDDEGNDTAPNVSFEWLKENIGFVHVHENSVFALVPQAEAAKRQFVAIVAATFGPTPKLRMSS